MYAPISHSDQNDISEPDRGRSFELDVWSNASDSSSDKDNLLQDNLSHVEKGTEDFNEQAREWPEYQVPLASKLSLLGLWLFLNLSMTLCNKATMQVFPYPWLLTFSQCSVSALGTFTLYLGGYFVPSKLSESDKAIIYGFSVLFTLNIAISNLSLSLVSVPFHQIIRAVGPVVTVILQRIFFNRSYPVQTYLSSVCIIAGVTMVTFGDYEFTILGFLLTVMGVVLASIKGIVTNHVMTGRLALSVLEVLYRLSPLAAVQCAIYAYLGNEIREFIDVAKAGSLSPSTYAAVFGNSFLAFLLNTTSFQANKNAGALTMAIAGNLKQCLTILISAILFNVVIGPLYAGGLVVALIGAAWYSHLELQAKK